MGNEILKNSVENHVESVEKDSIDTVIRMK